MRIVFLTTDDPIYLPAFFELVLGRWAAETLAVYVVPPLYRNQSRRAAAWRYYRTFGIGCDGRARAQDLRGAPEATVDLVLV